MQQSMWHTGPWADIPETRADIPRARSIENSSIGVEVRGQLGMLESKIQD